MRVEDQSFHLVLFYPFGLLGQRLVELIHLCLRRRNQLGILLLSLLLQCVELLLQLVVVHDEVRNGSLSAFKADLENHVLTRHLSSQYLVQLTLEADAIHLDHVLSLIVDILNKAFEVLNEVADEIFLEFAHSLVILLIDQLDFVGELQVCCFKPLFALALHSVEHIFVEALHVFIILMEIVKILVLLL